MEDLLYKAKDLLWIKLLANSQFFAFHFQWNEKPSDKYDFSCDELKWIIRCYPESEPLLRKPLTPLLQDQNYRILHLSDREIIQDFENVVQYLGVELGKQMGRPCGE